MQRGRYFYFFLAGLALLLALFVITDWLPNLRGPAPGTSEWYWPYRLRPFSQWWLALAATAVCWLLSAWWFRQPLRRPITSLSLIGLTIASFLLQLGLVYAHRPAISAELVDRTLADQQNGYFMAAANTEDMGYLLANFPQLMPTFISEHNRTHPPGLILINWLTIQAGPAFLPLADLVPPLRCTDLWLFNQPAETMAALMVWAYLPLIAASLTCIPLYLLGKRLYGSQVGRLAAIFGSLLPSLLLFAPMPDQLFALLSACTLLLWLKALDSNSTGYAFSTGLLLSFSTFLSLGNGALLLLLGIYALWHCTRPFALPPLRWFVALGLGLAGFWLVYWLGWGVPPWAVARVGLQQHYELVTLWRRYDWWLVSNLVDLFVFVGPIVIGGFLLALATAVRRLLSPHKQAGDGLVLGLGLLIIALDISGSTRGEVGRLWLFFMPLLAIVAAATFMAHQLAFRRFLLLLTAQLLLVVSMGLAWMPVEAIIIVAQRPSMPSQTSPQQSLTATFDQTINLLGYDLDMGQAEPGGLLPLTLYWQASRPAARPYTVFTHLINEQGELVAQKDNWPVAGQWPPTCWQPNEVVVDAYAIELTADLPPGPYTLLIGFYDAANGRRLLTSDNQDAFVLIEQLELNQK